MIAITAICFSLIFFIEKILIGKLGVCVAAENKIDKTDADAPIAGGVFIKSSQGDRFQHFLKETRIELRKVVWPTRQETFKTTGIIMIAVVIVAIFLWIVDAFFTWGVQSISSI